MGLMDNYTHKERVATIAFLKMVALSDEILKPEEDEIINLLAKNVLVTDDDINLLGEEKLKLTLKAMTKVKTHELLRMGYTILDIDDDVNFHEVKILNYLAKEHNIDLDDDNFIYSVIYTSDEFTPLDKIVLISYAYQMMFADSKIHKEEMRVLKKMTSAFGLNIDEVNGLIVPLDTLTKAVKTMSGPSVTKILKFLVHIAMVDNDLSKEEFDVIFPLLSEFNVSIESLMK
jgi:uncharacterized tellurite resistance protein B-like protein